VHNDNALNFVTFTAYDLASERKQQHEIGGVLEDERFAALRKTEGAKQMIAERI
jgi:hypothetical protein